MTQKKEHLLILRFSSLGDVALTIPVIRCLLKTYPNLQITIVSRKAMEPLFKEFKDINFFDVDFNHRHKGLKGIYQLYNDLRKIPITRIADLHSVICTHLLCFFFKINLFQVKKITKARFEKYLLTRKKNKKFQPLTPTIYRYADVFRRLGFPVDMQKHEFPLKKGIVPKIILKEILKNNNEKWIGIAPFAAFPGKIYPLDLMQKVISYLQKDHKLFLFGKGKKESQKFDIWQSAYPNVFSTVGLISFGDEINLISNLDLMISMDSANGHLSSNFGIPTITLWGVTHPFCGFTPFGQPIENSIFLDREKYPMIPTSIYGKKVFKGYQKALRSIDPKVIIEKAIELLSK